MKPRIKLNRAIGALPLEVRLDIQVRLERYDDPQSQWRGMELVGITRSLHSYLEEAIRRAEPDWLLVKQLHKAWVLSSVYDHAERGERT